MAKRVRSSSLKTPAKLQMEAAEREEWRQVPYRVERRRVVIDGEERELDVKVYPSTVRPSCAGAGPVVRSSPAKPAVFGGMQSPRRGSGY